MGGDRERHRWTANRWSERFTEGTLEIVLKTKWLSLGILYIFLYTPKKVGKLRNLCRGEEPLRLRMDLPNLKRFSKCSPISFRFGKSIRNLNGSSTGDRFRNIPISFRVYARISQWCFRKYVPASNNRWCLDWIQSRVKWVEAMNVTCK
jgi:hypothetical protein